MDAGKVLEANLSGFSVHVKSFAHNDKKFDEEDLVVIFLYSWLETYKDVGDAIKYSRNALTQTIVTNALRSVELEVKKKKNN